VARTTTLLAIATQLWTVPGSPSNPIEMIESDIITFSVKFVGSTSATVSAITAYKDGTDITATAFASGSTSAAGNTVTWKPLTAASGDGGEVYIIASKCTVDTQTETRKTYIKILTDEGEV